ncbi:unnamed protein product [Caenorhabditis angaria]|uniref:Uncharacterized protein n=1 Tax=Caenorhabditis angaria TaxID=860376 RepID=A0A9P1J040_9PELO|nr:unnamed protein product [Caenorhabditis angaria]
MCYKVFHRQVYLHIQRVQTIIKKYQSQDGVGNSSVLPPPIVKINTTASPPKEAKNNVFTWTRIFNSQCSLSFGPSTRRYNRWDLRSETMKTMSSLEQDYSTITADYHSGHQPDVIIDGIFIWIFQMEQDEMVMMKTICSIMKTSRKVEKNSSVLPPPIVKINTTASPPKEAKNNVFARTRLFNNECSIHIIRAINPMCYNRWDLRSETMKTMSSLGQEYPTVNAVYHSGHQPDVIIDGIFIWIFQMEQDEMVMMKTICSIMKTSRMVEKRDEVELMELEEISIDCQESANESDGRFLNIPAFHEILRTNQHSVRSNIINDAGETSFHFKPKIRFSLVY